MQIHYTNGDELEESYRDKLPGVIKEAIDKGASIGDSIEFSVGHLKGYGVSDFWTLDGPEPLLSYEDTVVIRRYTLKEEDFAPEKPPQPLGVLNNERPTTE